MKENTVGDTLMLTTQELATTNTAVASSATNNRMQKYCYSHLACKENVLEQHQVGLGTSIHNGVGPLRPTWSIQQQQQQQQLPLHLQATEVEPANLEAVSPAPLKAPPLLNSFGHTHMVRTTRQQQQQQQQQQSQLACKLRFSQQLGSCDVERSPFPQLRWAQSADLWRTMRSKDIVKAAPEAELRLHHPEILSSMRVILLDWMMEVRLGVECVTFHLVGVAFHLVGVAYHIVSYVVGL